MQLNRKYRYNFSDFTIFVYYIGSRKCYILFYQRINKNILVHELF